MAQDLAWIGEFLAWFLLAQLGILWLVLPIVVISIRRHLDKSAARQQRVIDELLLLRGAIQSLLGPDAAVQAQTLQTGEAAVRVSPLSLNAKTTGGTNGSVDKKSPAPAGGQNDRQDPPPLRADTSPETGTSTEPEDTAGTSASTVETKTAKSSAKASGQPFLDQMLGAAGPSNGAAEALDKPIPVVNGSDPEEGDMDAQAAIAAGRADFGASAEQAATSIQLNANGLENGAGAGIKGGETAGHAGDYDDDDYGDGFESEDEADLGESVAEMLSRAAPKDKDEIQADIVQTEDGCYMYRGKRYTRKADAERQQRIDMRP